MEPTKVPQNPLQTNHYAINHHFMTKINDARKSVGATVVPLPMTPTDLTQALAKFRLSLLLEEFKEACAAAACHLTDDEKTGEIIVENMEEGKFDLVEFVDACADIDVINTGNLIQCGVPDLLVKELVNENNLAKFGPGHSVREDGKLIKPPDHQKPRFDRLVKILQRWPDVVEYSIDGDMKVGESHAIYGILTEKTPYAIKPIDVIRSYVYGDSVKIIGDMGIAYVFRVHNFFYREGR